MFGQNNEQPTQPVMPVSPPQQGGDVYVMPDKFHPKVKKSSASPLIISAIVLIVVIVGIGGYFAYSYLTKQEVPVAENNTNNAATDFGNEEAQMPVTTTEDVVTTTDDSLATSTASSTDNLSSSTTSSLQTVSLTPPQSSPDTDNDGLTDLEENLIGTSPINADSDKDGFKDGDEIVNGYSPLIAGSSASAKLEVASFIKIVKTDFADDNFSLPIIKQWSFSTIKATKQAIITTETGEIIKISVKENPNRLSALDWYLRVNSQISPMQLKQVEYGDLSGIITPDGLSAYLSDPLKTRIYSFEYIMDSGSQMRYPNLFKMMIKKFTLVAGGNNVATSTATSSDNSSF